MNTRGIGAILLGRRGSPATVGSRSMTLGDT
jgi:hypothetical protein